ncbi:MAG: hypothetical protein ISR01_06375 [Chitinophagales bacterium]|nr:hypothetical protein [Chitinophagales bacterium]
MRKIFLAFKCIMFSGVLFGQVEDDVVDYEKTLLLSPIISLQIPGVELAERFGLAYQFGLAIEYKFAKNWSLGGEGGFLFGTKVKETDHIEEALTLNGLVITEEGSLDNVDLNLRGAVVKVNVGKSFFFSPEKPSNGLLLKLGVGYLQHKILIDVNKRITPQLSGEYAKGYDRLSSGLLLSQYIGLIRLEKGKFVNLSIGFELTEGFTSNRRPFDFHLQRALKESRVDLMYGVKISWMIPVYLGQSSSNQYYTY